MKYSHQLYEDSSLRSKDRLSKLSTLPENELRSFEISINQQVFKINDIMQSNDDNQILKEILILYDLTNRGVTISDGVFKNDKFIENLSLLIRNPTFCMSACKLLARILYITDKFGVFLHEFIIPLFEIFLENIRNPEVECIVSALCNLSGDLLYYEFEDGYNDPTVCHPLKKIARDIRILGINVNESNYTITYSYLLFIRHLANFSLPTENLSDMIEYLKSLLIDPQVQCNNEFKKLILWTLFDCMEAFSDASSKAIVQGDFISFLVSQMKDDDFLFAEPILGIFYYLNVPSLSYYFDDDENEEKKEGQQKSDVPIYDFDLPCVFSLCLSAHEESVQFEAFQLVHILTECYPLFMYSHDVIKLLEQASESNCPYRIRYQILWIACILISRHDISFLSTDSLKILLTFIVNNSLGDEERELLAIQNLQYLRRTLLLERKPEFYDQLAAESGVNDFVEELRDRNDENICNAIEIYDNLETEAASINEACDGLSAMSPLFMPFYDDKPLSAEEAEMIQDLDMLDDDDDDDDDVTFNYHDDDDMEVNQNHHPVTRIRFVYNPV